MSQADPGKYYDEMLALYDQFVQGELENHYTSYFEQLVRLYEQGNLITRIHALEMILNIILGGKWTGERSRPTAEGSSAIRALQLQLQPKLQKADRPTRTPHAYPTQKVAVPTMIDWLEKVLLDEQEEDILKVYFIFIKTHWQHIQIEEPEIFDRLYELHRKLLHNPKYGKLEVFEQINERSYDKGYRRLH